MKRGFERFLTLVFIISLLTFTGCSMVGGGGQGSASITKVDIYEGTQGLEMEFVKNKAIESVRRGAELGRKLKGKLKK